MIKTVSKFIITALWFIITTLCFIITALCFIIIALGFIRTTLGFIITTITSESLSDLGGVGRITCAFKTISPLMMNLVYQNYTSKDKTVLQFIRTAPETFKVVLEFIRVAPQMNRTAGCSINCVKKNI